MDVNEGSLLRQVIDIEEVNGKLTYSSINYYAVSPVALLVVFVIHTVSYIICDSMSNS